jgi:hypothetical protein
MNPSQIHSAMRLLCKLAPNSRQSATVIDNEVVRSDSVSGIDTSYPIAVNEAMARDVAMSPFR